MRSEVQVFFGLPISHAATGTVFVFYFGKRQIFDIVKEGSSAPKFLQTIYSLYTSLEDDLVRFTSKIDTGFLPVVDRRHKS